MKDRHGHGSEKQQPSKKLRRAIGALLSGEAKTQKEACAIAGMHQSAFSKRIKDPHVRQFLETEVRQRLSTTGFISAARVLETLTTSAKSEYVKADAAKHLLAINGVKPTTDAPTGAGGGISYTLIVNGQNVKIGAESVQSSRPNPQVIEHEPQLEAEHSLTKGVVGPGEAETGGGA